MADRNVFDATLALLDERGWVTIAPLTSKSTDPITVFGAMRQVCGIDPGAWLPAYENWKVTTAPYVHARAALSELVASEAESNVDVDVWLSRLEYSGVRQVLVAGSETYPKLLVPDPLPKLRPGCNPRKLVSSVKVSGVLISALAALVADRHERIGKCVSDAAASAGIDVRTVGNEEFLEALLAGHSDGPVSVELDGDTDEIIRLLRVCAQTRADYRLSRLLSALADVQGVGLPDLEDDHLRRVLNDLAQDSSLLDPGGVPPGESIVINVLGVDKA